MEAWGGTYANDSRIIRDGRRLRLFGSTGGLLNAQVLHVTTPKDDVLVDLFRSRHLF